MEPSRQADSRLCGEPVAFKCVIDHTDEINSVYALVPIIVYCFDRKGDHLSDVEIRKLVKWFYYSQVRTRYVSQLPQKLDRDLRTVAESKNPFDELLAAIAEERRLPIVPDEFVGRAVSHPLFGLMRWYFKSEGAICFSTGLAIRQAMGKKYQLENDHISLIRSWRRGVTEERTELSMHSHKS